MLATKILPKCMFIWLPQVPHDLTRITFRDAFGYTVIPEPATLALLLISGFAILGTKRS
ncbi:MAG: PEP-CTERM sorting domain-containing protein [Actinobacteria bacterium]|nr:PEP-CTERM sorting domain-containing protein [Actinomycetota bacterium]